MKNNNSYIGFLNGTEIDYGYGNSISVMKKFCKIRDRLIQDEIKYDLIVFEDRIFMDWIEDLFPDEYPEVREIDYMNSAYGYDFYFNANPYGDSRK